MSWWYMLLTAWRNKGKNGLTLPFLIGSQRYLHNVDSLSIKDLITEMASSAKTQVILTHCIDINELIFCVRDENNNQLGGNFVRLEKGLRGSLYVSKIVDIYNQNDLIIHLEDRYKHLIENNRFSKVDYNEWGYFTENDVDFIAKTFDAI